MGSIGFSASSRCYLPLVAYNSLITTSLVSQKCNTLYTSITSAMLKHGMPLKKIPPWKKKELEKVVMNFMNEF